MVCITDCACVQGRNPNLPGVKCPGADQSCAACWLTQGGSTRCNPTQAEILKYGFTCPGANEAPPSGGTGHGGTTPPVKHCTPVVYNNTNHCLGDACGPGGAGAIYINPTLGVVCSRSNPPTGGGGGGGGGTLISANQVEFDLIQTLAVQLGSQFVRDNEACLRNAFHQYGNFTAMQRVPVTGNVPYQGGPAYFNYKNGLLAALKRDYVCVSEGGSKTGGQQACTGMLNTGTCSGAGRPAVCDIDCNNIGFFDSLVNGLPAFCNDANCCRQAQANANCAAFGAQPAGGGGGGGSGDFCQRSFGINCPQLGLIGAVALFGMFILIIVKR